MQDDGWYSSFVGKSARPWENVQKLAQMGPMRRETFLVSVRLGSCDLTDSE